MPASSWGSNGREVSPPRDDGSTRQIPSTSPTFGPGKGPHPLTAFEKPIMPRTNSTVSWPTTTASEEGSVEQGGDPEKGISVKGQKAGPRMGKLAKPMMLRSLTAMSWSSEKTNHTNQEDNPNREDPTLKKSASRISFSSWKSGSSGGSVRKKQVKKPAAKEGQSELEDEELLEGERRIRFRPSAIISEPQSLHEPRGGMPNQIRTARFTMLTWLPLSLFHQFQRVANVYFLCIVVLVMFPWSPKDWKSKVFPFSLVLFWTACKDLHEDARRRRDDALENQQRTTVFDIASKKFIEKEWQDILVGDVILVECDKAFPADLILIYAGGSHEAFISTITLDGETNLKERLPPAVCENFAVEAASPAPTALSKRFSVTKASDIAMKVMHEMHTQYFSCKVGQPEVAVQDVKGTLHANTYGEACPISFNNFLPRGCVLRNTNWILALVVFVGDETKTRLNTAKSRSKVSNMQKYLNQCVWGLLAGLVVVCTYAATARVSIEGEFSLCCGDKSWIVRFCIFMITFYHVVPMSLYVVFEMLKLFLGWQVNTDKQMQDPETGALAIARTADLIEEMGQINFAFSDKTGTLTKNEMLFARACVGGKDLGDFRTTEPGKEPESTLKVKEALSAPSLDSYWTDVNWFFTCLATCHSVQVSFTEKDDASSTSPRRDSGDGTPSQSHKAEMQSARSHATSGSMRDSQRRYLGMSPDEVCLVEIAQQVGIVFCSRTRPAVRGAGASSELTIRMRDGREKVFSILYELEFNSDRKRMSVIMREGNEVYLVTKGADIVMEPLLTEAFTNEYKDSLKQYSQSGF